MLTTADEGFRFPLITKKGYVVIEVIQQDILKACDIADTSGWMVERSRDTVAFLQMTEYFRRCDTSKYTQQGYSQY